MNEFKILSLIFFVAVAGGFALFLADRSKSLTPNVDRITSFEECVRAGYTVFETYPRQCRDDNGTLFIEEVAYNFPISYVNATPDDIFIHELSEENNSIASPLTVTGEARGWWFFEASFPVVLTDDDGLIILETFATAQSNWMTEELVPFEVTLTFNSSGSGERGSLILMRDNPSALPENDASFEIPIIFE